MQVVWRPASPTDGCYPPPPPVQIAPTPTRRRHPRRIFLVATDKLSQPPIHSIPGRPPGPGILAGRLPTGRARACDGQGGFRSLIFRELAPRTRFFRQTTWWGRWVRGVESASRAVEKKRRGMPGPHRDRSGSCPQGYRAPGVVPGGGRLRGWGRRFIFSEKGGRTIGFREISPGRSARDHRVSALDHRGERVRGWVILSRP
jgi:hypothetical protein